jgi:hypothetical protein
VPLIFFLDARLGVVLRADDVVVVGLDKRLVVATMPVLLNRRDGGLKPW